MKRILEFKKSTDGQSLVEFALVLPILILLILGMIEFGWILNGKITLTSAVREGARAAIVCESQTKALTAAQTAVNNSAASSSLTNITTTVNTFDLTTRKAVVTVTATIKPIIGLYVSRDGINLSANAVMRIE